MVHKFQNFETSNVLTIGPTSLFQRNLGGGKVLQQYIMIGISYK